MAFESFMIGDTAENVVEDGETQGFRIPVRIPYYRGVVLSLIEGIEVAVDEVEFPRNQVRFAVRDVELSLDEVAWDGRTRWEFGEWASVIVKKAGGLEPGEHDVHMTQQFRISYLPWPMRAEAAKRVTVAG